MFVAEHVSTSVTIPATVVGVARLVHPIPVAPVEPATATQVIQIVAGFA